jgi:antitoxin YobK
MAEHDSVALVLAELTRDWDGEPVELSGPASEDEVRLAERELGVVFPASYRAFLRTYGAGTLPYCEIFGIPGDRLWGDVVMMNQVPPHRPPAHYVKFTADVGDLGYYLDTSRWDAAGECPVVVFGPGDDGRVVADSFLDFLAKAKDGLV